MDPTAMGENQESLPRLSLIITTYNRADMLVQALQSVAASNVDDAAMVEVIVVDNNSRDHTRAEVERLRAGEFPFDLRYVFETNQGLSAARNRGASEARGFYLVFMDDDQLISNHYLRSVEDAFQKTGATCVGGPLLYYNATGLPNWLPELLAYVGQFDGGDEIKKLTPDGEMLRGGNMAIAKKDLLAAGGYNEDLGRKGHVLIASEETDLQSRLCRAGKTIVYDPRLVQYHYLRPERLKKRYWRRHRFDWGRTVYKYNQDKGQTSNVKRFLGVPRWYWRHLVTNDISNLLCSVRGDKNKLFDRQLDICFRLGQMYEARHQYKDNR